MESIILSAGKGTRIKGFQDGTPKPLLKFKKKSLLIRHIEKLRAAGFSKIHINISSFTDQIQAHLEQELDDLENIEIHHEGDEPLETAGGIINIIPKIKQNSFSVINSDILTNFEFKELTKLSPHNYLVLVNNPPWKNKSDYGISAQGIIIKHQEKYTFSGISVLDKSLFEGFLPGKRSLTEIFDRAIDNQALKGIVTKSLWFDMGTPERFKEAENYFND